jgi:hypothetical protein
LTLNYATEIISHRLIEDKKPRLQQMPKLKMMLSIQDSRRPGVSGIGGYPI